MDNSIKDISVVIRSSYERTEALCIHLVKQQVPKEMVTVIHERPFSQALRRAFEIGLDFGLTWTLCVDADVLIRHGAIGELITAVETYSGRTLGGSGMIFDKLRWSRRRGGIHLYRTALLPNLIPYISDADVSLRPETDAKWWLLEQGYEWALVNTVVGLHDFEQYYADIFRKMVVRARKSPDMNSALLKLALARSPIDKDFMVAAWGLQFGMSLSLKEQIELDAQQWAKETELLLLANGLQEKNSLPVDEGNAFVENTVAECHTIFATTRGLLQRLFQNPIHNWIWQLGRSVTQIGERLQRLGIKSIRHNKL